ncbi:MAG TPA: flagellin [bacterium]|nr:flagellin [bacterium]HOL48549.1 flagellin [bacterium]HPQ19250.1 flagellin [bacterium]
MLSINNFWAARIAARNLGLSNLNLSKSIEKLTTGKRINSAADDPAGLAIAKRLTVQINSLTISSDNIQSGVALLSTTEGALDSMLSILQRMYSLANQAANGTLTSSDRLILQTEVNELISEIDRISTSTEFNGVKLLTGDYSTGNGSILIQVGPNNGNYFSFNIDTASSEALYVNSVSITSISMANFSMDLIQSGINRLSTLRSNIGAVINRLNSASSLNEDIEMNYSFALSNIEDTDFAAEMVNYVKYQMLAQAAASFFAQANLQYSSVFDLMTKFSSS